MTYEQIFSGEMVLRGAQRHLAQKSIHYRASGSIERFDDAASADAFTILEQALTALRQERAAKFCRRSVA